MLLRQLRTLLRAAVTDPSVRLLDQPAADPAPQPAEQAAGAGVTPAPHRWVDRHAAEPDLVAVAHGAHRWSYRWLSEAVNRVAEVLARREVASAAPVGVVRRPSAAFVAVLVGAAKHGRTSMVIETDDPALTGPLGLTTVLDPNPAGELAAGTVDVSALLPADGGEPPDPAVAGEVPADWAVQRWRFSRLDRFVVLSHRPGHLISALGSAFAAGARLVIPECEFGGDTGAVTAWLRDNEIPHACTGCLTRPVAPTGASGGSMSSGPRC